MEKDDAPRTTRDEADRAGWSAANRYRRVRMSLVVCDSEDDIS